MPTIMKIKTYNKKFARRQWKKSSGNLFCFRGKFSPSFRSFTVAVVGEKKNETIP